MARPKRPEDRRVNLRPKRKEDKHTWTGDLTEKEINTLRRPGRDPRSKFVRGPLEGELVRPKDVLDEEAVETDVLRDELEKRLQDAESSEKPAEKPLQLPAPAKPKLKRGRFEDRRERERRRTRKRKKMDPDEAKQEALDILFDYRAVLTREHDKLCNMLERVKCVITIMMEQCYAQTDHVDVVAGTERCEEHGSDNGPDGG